MKSTLSKVLQHLACSMENQYILYIKQNSTNLNWHFITGSFVRLTWHSSDKIDSNLMIILLQATKKGIGP